MASDFGFHAFNGTRKKAFISYKKSDEQLVKPIAKALYDAGAVLWYDEMGEAGLSPGEHWEDIILMNINLCSVVIAFISNEFFRAGNSFMRQEISAATDFNKPIIVVLLEPIDEDNISTFDNILWQRLRKLQTVNAYEYPVYEELAAAILPSITRKIDEDTRDIAKLKQDLENEYYERNRERNGRITAAEADECGRLVSDAYLLMEHYRTTCAPSDIDNARKKLASATQKYPADYRGWLALIELVATDRNNLSLAIPREGRKKKLEEVEMYYSYINSSDSEHKSLIDERYRFAVVTVLERDIECALRKWKLVNTDRTAYDLSDHDENFICFLENFLSPRVNPYIDRDYCSDVKKQAEKLLQTVREKLKYEKRKKSYVKLNMRNEEKKLKKWEVTNHVIFIVCAIMGFTILMGLMYELGPIAALLTGNESGKIPFSSVLWYLAISICSVFGYYAICSDDYSILSEHDKMPGYVGGVELAMLIASFIWPNIFRIAVIIILICGVIPYITAIWRFIPNVFRLIVFAFRGLLGVLSKRTINRLNGEIDNIEGIQVAFTAPSDLEKPSGA